MSPWREVESTLTAEIRDGRLLPGTRLPTEPALMRLRQRLADLPVLDYRLSERTRFSQNLLAQGREPAGLTLLEEEVAASEDIAAALRLPRGEPVYHVRRLGLADEVPINLSNACYPVRRFPGMIEARRAPSDQRRSITAVL